ncbi:MAG: hypothetical protein MHM6MM_001458 [Cercozoa sp. M6MM]
MRSHAFDLPLTRSHAQSRSREETSLRRIARRQVRIGPFRVSLVLIVLAAFVGLFMLSLSLTPTVGDSDGIVRDEPDSSRKYEDTRDHVVDDQRKRADDGKRHSDQDIHKKQPKQPKLPPQNEPVPPAHQPDSEKNSPDSQPKNGIGGAELPLIWVAIPSFRDPACPGMVRNLLITAKHPERVRVAVYDQLERGVGDVPCASFLDPCEKAYRKHRPVGLLQEMEGEFEFPEEKKQRILNAPLGEHDRGKGRGSQGDDLSFCKYAHQVKVLEIAAATAQGVVPARYMAEQMILMNEESNPFTDFILQSDAHNEFADDWDVRALDQWKKVNNDNAVLSVYPLSSKLSPPPKGPRVTLLCGMHFKEGLFGMPKWIGELRTLPSIKDGFDEKGDMGTPVRQQLFAAGFAFSKLHRAVRVPNDPHLPFVFDGEELSMAVRLFTWGYDVYAPLDQFIFHAYYEKTMHRPHIWDTDWGVKSQIQKRCTSRIHHVLGLLPPVAENNQGEDGLQLNQFDLPKEYDHSECDVGQRYGAGTVRNVASFYHWGGFDILDKRKVNHCAAIADRKLPPVEAGDRSRLPNWATDEAIAHKYRVSISAKQT